MKKGFLTIGLLSSMIAFAQNGNIGINTTSPKTTLDINPSTANASETATTNEGILIPRLSKQRVANIAEANLVNGTLIFVSDYSYTTTDTTISARIADITREGFYYYSSSANKWNRVYIDTDTNTNAPKFDYILSADGTILMRWLNSYTTDIDMNTLTDIEDVTTIAQDLITNNVQIKSFVMREGVTQVGVRAFQNSPQIAITFANSLQVIEANAFEGNTTITELNLPNVTEIGASAFQGTTSLTSISIPKLTTVNNYTFAGSGITEIKATDLPEVTTIKDSAFSDSASLTSINLPKVTTIEDSAFMNTGLTSVTLPEVTTLGYGVFRGTPLTTISLPKATTITGTFAYAENLTSVDLPEVITVGGRSFEETKIVNITLPKATTIEDEGFYAGSSVTLKSVNLPVVTSIGSNAFKSNNANATTVTIGTATPPTIQSDTFRSGITIKVPKAYLSKYKSAWNGKLNSATLVGY